MRPIKYRALTGNDNWVIGGYYYDPIHEAHIIVNGTGTHYTIKPETLGQFTGLLDKNGKEIYEGDVIDYKARHYEKRMPVEFRDGGYCVRDGVRTYEICENAIGSCDVFEVIGNIYESPEPLR